MKVIESGRLVMPLESREAEQFARRNLLSIHGRIRRIGALVRTPPVAGSTSELKNVSALDLAAGAAATPRFEEALSRSGLLTHLQAGRWLLMRDYGSSSRGRSVLFVFEHDVSTPRAVIRMRRTASPDRSLRVERDVLSWLAANVSPQLLSVVPEVIAYEESADYELLVLSGVPGQPLDMAMQRSLRPRTRHAPALWSAGRWLGQLHCDTRAQTGGGASIMHGDFWPRNLLFDSGELTGAVDWEHASISGTPAEDLFTLPLLFVMDSPSWRGEDPLARFVEGFLRDGTVSRIVRRYFQEYCAAGGIVGETLPLVFNEYLARSAEQARKTKQGWKAKYPWRQMQSELARAAHSVFSG